MTEIEIPDNEELRSLACLRDLFNERNEYCWASMVDAAARRLRADAEEIARLESELATAKTEAAAQRELATLLERESPDPLTRIAAVLERAKRWLDLDPLAGYDDYHSTKLIRDLADALLAEMGEG